MAGGIINVYKEKGFTSHDVVAKLRGILKMKRIGHTGTLDPDAEGVLPVCIGKATKLVDLITDKDKTYEAVLKLGITTDTQDITGKIIKTGEVTVDKQRIEEVIKSYIGLYEQLPPMYSAIKVDGKKLYELARQGKEIERKRRPVMIHNIQILDYSEEVQEIRVVVDCGKGTYIRTLLHDIGEELGCGGVMKSLLRTRVGNFFIEEALRLTELSELAVSNTIDKVILPIDAMFTAYPAVKVNEESLKYLLNGNSLTNVQMVEPEENITDGWVRVYDTDGNFTALYQYDSELNCFTPVKMFL